MVGLDLIVGSDPVGRRAQDSGLDTNEQLSQQYFAVMHFRDKAQSERAWDWIMSQSETTDQLHRRMWAQARNMTFFAWEDLA